MRGAMRLAECILDYTWNEVSLGIFSTFLFSQTDLVKSENVEHDFIA